MNTEINDLLIKKKEVVVEEVKEKVKKEGDEEDSQDQQDEDEDDEEKKKVVFNPNEFDWTESNGNPKQLAQIFNKMKSNVLKVFWQFFCIIFKETVEVDSKKLEMLDDKLGLIIMTLNDGLDNNIRLIEGLMKWLCFGDLNMDLIFLITNGFISVFWFWILTSSSEEFLIIIFSFIILWIFWILSFQLKPIQTLRFFLIIFLTTILRDRRHRVHSRSHKLHLPWSLLLLPSDFLPDPRILFLSSLIPFLLPLMFFSFFS